MEQQNRQHDDVVGEAPPDESNAVGDVKPLELKDSKTPFVDQSKNFSKLLVDMTAGKLEVAWGKTDSSDVEEIARLLRALLIPTLGLGLKGELFTDTADPTMHFPSEFSQMGHFMNLAYDHITIKLGLATQPKNPASADLEAASLHHMVGLPNFGGKFREAVETFCAGRGKRVTTWTREKTDNWKMRKEITRTSLHSKERFLQQHLYKLLYIEQLMENSSRSALDLIMFVDLKSQTKNHLILPTSFLQGHWQHFRHAPEDPEHSVTRSESRLQETNIPTEGHFNMIDAEIEHLPPETIWERQSDHFRTIGHVLKSPESVFGLRVTLATLSTGIAAFLENSQEFFQRNRLVWALVMSTIGMSWTSGQSVLAFSSGCLGA